MPIRPRLWWEEIRNSLWFVPAVFTLLGLTLAVTTISVDRWLVSQSNVDLSWAFGGGAEGARGVLSAIAGSLITVTGVVFSVTVVALQLASSQFTPRVLRNFMGDSANQVVLGVFIGTFTYALLVLRSVRSPDEGATFVPALSVTTSIVLTIVSVGFLIYFIDHTARSIQASNIIDRTTQQALQVVERLFPKQAQEPSPFHRSNPSTVRAAVTTAAAGYVQNIDLDALGNLSQKAALSIEVVPPIGQHLLPGATIAFAWPAANLDDDARKQIGQAIIQGHERSASEDIEFAITRLADIAIKALSPSVNDPTTARICVNRLAEILVVLGNRVMPPIATRGDGEQGLAIMHQATYDQCVTAAFGTICHFGAGTSSFAGHILNTLAQAYELVPADRGLILAKQAETFLQSALQQARNPNDAAAISKAGSWLTQVQGPGLLGERRQVSS